MTIARYARDLLFLAVAFTTVAKVQSARACPFCTALKPSLSQRRDNATIFALGEAAETSGDARLFLLHAILKGADRLANSRRLPIPGHVDLKSGTLVIVLGNDGETPDAMLAWEVVPVTETGYAYAARLPSPHKPPAERLPYFIPFLEHAEPVLAEDAYLEFGHAPFDLVAEVADRLPMGSMRKWLIDPMVPPERKGFYGLALGLARNDYERQANLELLKKVVVEPAGDFRSGYDGVLGGFLLAAGEPGLELVERRILANPQAAQGDLRHALTALRFYHEYGHEVPRERLLKATRLLLERPELSAAVIVDLARWQDWEVLPTVVALFDRDNYREPAIRRAIVGYLLACPKPEAAEAFSVLREKAPKDVADAEKQLSVFGSGR